MEVKCNNAVFGDQDVVIMVKFTDSGHILTQMAFKNYLQPLGDAAGKKLHDAVAAVLNETAKEMKGRNTTEVKQ